MKNKGFLYRIINILCILCLLGSVAYLIINWNQFPDKIPSHYNFQGEIDTYSNKASLWLIPIINIFIFIFLTLIESFPSLWNTGIEITENNKQAVFKLIRNMLAAEKLTVIFFLSYLSYHTTTFQPLPSSFGWIFLFTSFGIIILYLIRLLFIKRLN